MWKLGYAQVKDISAKTRAAHVLLLQALDTHQHAIQSKDALLQCAGLLCKLAWLRRGFVTGVALHHDIKVDKLLSKGGHVIFEAKGIFADDICGEDVIALALALAL